MVSDLKSMLTKEEYDDYVWFVDYLKTLNFSDVSDMVAFANSYINAYNKKLLDKEPYVLAYLKYVAVSAQLMPTFVWYVDKIETEARALIKRLEPENGKKELLN